LGDCNGNKQAAASFGTGRRGSRNRGTGKKAAGAFVCARRQPMWFAESTQKEKPKEVSLGAGRPVHAGTRGAEAAPRTEGRCAMHSACAVGEENTKREAVRTGARLRTGAQICSGVAGGQKRLQGWLK
jgi:hypothetical protein